MTRVPHAPDRLLDLLTSHATEGLSFEEELELRSLMPGELDEHASSLELSAAALHLAWLDRDAAATIPASLQRRLAEGGRRWSEDRRRLLSQADAFRGRSPNRVSRLARFAPWALAAGLTFALIFSRTAPNGATGAMGGESIADATDTITMAWKPWDGPEIAGVGGSIAWNERLQRGEMIFTGLPLNDPSRTQYQLWIVDERGMEQRINGAIFDSRTEGTLRVDVSPSIHVRRAAAFAVTIESPGGTWVSDMKRRVVIATKG